jgi:hypothetical protein
MNVEAVMNDYAKISDEQNNLVVVVKRNPRVRDVVFNVYVPSPDRRGYKRCMNENSNWDEAMDDAMCVYRIIMALR